MEEMDGNEERRAEVGVHLTNMGKSLLKEGNDVKDHTLMVMGNTLILFGGVMNDKQSFVDISNLLSMYSAKRMLDSLTSDGLLGKIMGSGDIDPSEYGFNEDNEDEDED